ncbi:MAG: DUF5362 family protein [Candidatus Hydrothermales bacterium]
MEIYESASKGSGWIRFFGVISIIGGVLQVFTIIGIIWAWITIWIGVVALQAASAADKANLTKKEEDLVQFHSKIKQLFQLIGIFIIISIVIAVIVAVIALIFSAFLLSFLYQLGGLNL